uniref:Uncharacterized protein MANES_03G140900 n=2 Tax=Rhizophora mucronata TaxID=61149 RepID=A0A2P2LVR5_RHIMU
MASLSSSSLGFTFSSLAFSLCLAVLLPDLSFEADFFGAEDFSTFSSFFLDETFGVASLSSSACMLLDDDFLGVLFGGGLDLLATDNFLFFDFPVDSFFLDGIFELLLRFLVSSSDSFFSSLEECSGTSALDFSGVPLSFSSSTFSCHSSSSSSFPSDSSSESGKLLWSVFDASPTFLRLFAERFELFTTLLRLRLLLPFSLSANKTVVVA